jgi:hypothetical protein
VIDRIQKDILRSNRAAVVKEQKGLTKLRRRLLDLGGDEVALRYEEDLEILLLLGKEFVGKARRRPGQQSQCHSNAGKLYQAGELAAIATGWALSADRIWRQHSWGIDWKGRIVETTEPRQMYFGIYMVRQSAEGFAEGNA